MACKISFVDLKKVEKTLELFRNSAPQVKLGPAHDENFFSSMEVTPWSKRLFLVFD